MSSSEEKKKKKESWGLFSVRNGIFVHTTATMYGFTQHCKLWDLLQIEELGTIHYKGYNIRVNSPIVLFMVTTLELTNYYLHG